MRGLCDDAINVIDLISQTSVQNLSNIVYKKYSDIRYMSCSFYV